MTLRRPFRRPSLLLAALALAAVAALSATAASRGGAARDGSPRIDTVAVRAVERPFADEDADGARGADGASGEVVVLDRELTIDGSGFFGTSAGPFVRFVTADGARVEAVMVVLESGGRIVAWPPAGLRGSVRVEVENPDGRTAAATAGL